MKKIIIGLGIILAVFLFIPLLMIKISPADAGMGLFIILFFMVNPITSVVIGAISGSNVKNMWWLPLVLSAVFPIFHAVALWISPAWELYIYSIGYGIIGYFSMLISHIIKKRKK